MTGLCSAVIRSRRPWRALSLVGVVAVACAATASWRMPVPLNQAGATLALAVLWGLILVLAAAPVLAREVPSLERWVPRRRVLRAASFGLVVVSLSLACLVVAVVSASQAGALAASSASCLGCYAVSVRVMPAPWISPLTLILGMIVFGVDRDRQTPRPWAWLLGEGAHGVTGVSVSLGLVALGAAVYILAPARRA